MSRTFAWDQFADSVGPDIAADLVRLWPGMEKTVPTSPTPRLIEHLGPRRARHLCDVAGGERLCVPVMLSDRIARRYRRVIEARRRGLTMNEVARETGLTVRHVRRIINSHKTPARAGQMELLK